MNYITQLKHTFKSIRYGWRNPITNKPISSKVEIDNIDVEDVWRLGTPEQTIASGVGNCYDTVAISRQKFMEEGTQFKVFFMFREDSKFDGKHWSEGATHIVCLYRTPFNDWRWIEGSWGKFKNNYWRSSDYKTLIGWIAQAMSEQEHTNIVVNEIFGYPSYGCDMTEFERFCRNCKTIFTTDIIIA